MIEEIEISGIAMAVRPETTDINCLKEVLEQKCYRHVRFKFDVEEGEHWLDLGGNIGALPLIVNKNKQLV